jgi:putative acetyltransferase
VQNHHIRGLRPADRPLLLSVWERAVRATHEFLTEADISHLRPLVAEYLAGEAHEIWVLAGETNEPIAFLGLADHAIDALFLDPAFHRRGAGRRLIAHAQALRGGALTVDVNEQNAGARGFYEALGFVAVGRSPLDDAGRPFPILHMRRDAPLSPSDETFPVLQRRNQ